MWSHNDRKFLRSVGIESQDPPAPLPRFHVEPSAVQGWFAVVDSPKFSFRRYEFGPREFKDPRAAAEDYAAQLNAKHVAQL